MKLSEVQNLKTGDIIYSFRDNNFYVYELKNIQLTPACREMTVMIVSVNNIPEEKIRYHLILIPNNNEQNTWQYYYEFTNISKDINEAYQNYSENINRQIRKLNGQRSNMKGIKRKYMLDNKMIPEHEKNWKELGYKSKEDYQEHMNDLYEDLRYGYIG